MLYMVSGLHDPRWLPNILTNFDRQKHRDKTLLIVENSAGIGATLGRELPSNRLVISSEPGASNYINAALRWLREEAAPSDWFCKCDADDYYGPSYLDQVASGSANVDFLGRKDLYIRTTEGRLWLLNATVFHGPTLAARVGTALDFPQVARWGEDVAWCEQMALTGRTYRALPPEGFCYQRWNNYGHTWPCTDVELRAAWGLPVVDLGPADYAVVDGTIPRPLGVVLDAPEDSPDNFMPFRLLREQAAT
jgi:hypothetical protein